MFGNRLTRGAQRLWAQTGARHVSKIGSPLFDKYDAAGKKKADSKKIKRLTEDMYRNMNPETMEGILQSAQAEASTDLQALDKIMNMSDDERSRLSQSDFERLLRKANIDPSALEEENQDAAANEVIENIALELMDMRQLAKERGSSPIDVEDRLFSKFFDDADMAERIKEKLSQFSNMSKAELHVYRVKRGLEKDRKKAPLENMIPSIRQSAKIKPSERAKSWKATKRQRRRGKMY